jgi:xanthine dehydrogenase accessory factor
MIPERRVSKSWHWVGCNGVIDVLIEPLQAEQKVNPVTLFENLILQNEPVAMATIYTGSELGEKTIDYL